MNTEEIPGYPMPRCLRWEHYLNGLCAVQGTGSSFLEETSQIMRPPFSLYGP